MVILTNNFLIWNLKVKRGKNDIGCKLAYPLLLGGKKSTKDNPDVKSSYSSCEGESLIFKRLDKFVFEKTRAPLCPLHITCISYRKSKAKAHLYEYFIRTSAIKYRFKYQGSLCLQIFNIKAPAANPTFIFILHMMLKQSKVQIMMLKGTFKTCTLTIGQKKKRKMAGNNYDFKFVSFLCFKRNSSYLLYQT